MTIKRVIKKLKENLKESELDFLNYILERLETFNSVYLLTKRFIDKIETYSDEYFKSKTGNAVNKYHYYTNLGFKFIILLKEVEWHKLDYIQRYRDLVLNLGLEEEYIYDKDVENAIKTNEFYKLIFTIKLIEGVDNE